MGKPPSIIMILSKIDVACTHIPTVQLCPLSTRAPLNPAVRRAMTSPPLAHPRSFLWTGNAMDFNDLCLSLDAVTVFASMVGVIMDDDKVSVLL